MKLRHGVVSEIADKWILQFRWSQHDPWMDFGLPHPFDEGVRRLDDVRVRLADCTWQLVNVTTGGVLHDRQRVTEGS